MSSRLWLGLALGVSLLMDGPAAADVGASALEAAGDLEIEQHDPDAVAVAPDGSSVYVGFGATDTVAHFDRDLATGEMNFVGSVTNGVDAGSHMASPADIIVSPDGAHLYVSSSVDSAITVFSRDLASGALTLASAVVDGVGGIDDLGGVQFLEMGSASQHLYASARGDDAITVFSRDAATGALSLLEAHVDPAGSIYSVDGVSLSPDGLFAYAALADATVVYSRDGTTGALTEIQQLAHGPCSSTAASPLRISPDGEHAYVSTFHSTLTFDRDNATGTLVAPTCPQTGRVYLRISADGKHVYASSGSGFTDRITLFTRDAATGVLTFASQITLDPNVTETQDLVLAWSPEGQLLATRARGFDVVAFDRDAVSGELTPAAVGMAGPAPSIAATVISPDGDHAYVTHPDQDGLSVFSRDHATGALTHTESHYDGFYGVSGLTGQAILISPDGGHVYAVSRWDEGQLAVFARDAATGGLTFVEAHFEGVAGVLGMEDPQGQAISPDGGHVYVSGTRLGQGRIVRFSRDSGTGALTFLGAIPSTAPEALALSPDGQDLYALTTDGPSPSTLFHYARDASSGELALIATHSNSPEPLGLPLAWTERFAVSPDGQNVYVGAAEFARDAVTGELSHLGLVGGSPFVPKTATLASPDGTTVYMDRAAYHRHPESGRLLYIEPIGESVSAMSPDAAYLYAARSGFEDSIHWYSPSFRCAPAPLAGCKTADKGSLTVTTSLIPQKRRVTWGWINGEPSTLTQMEENDQVLCLYDGSGTTFFSALIPKGGDCRTLHQVKSKPCWTTTTKVIKYGDRYADPDGVKKHLLKPSDVGKARIKLKAQGATMPIPSLPVSAPVVAQLQSRNGSCWESTFTTAKKNDELRLKMKLP